MEGNESLIMRNDTKNADEAGEMQRTLSFSPEGITEVTAPKLTGKIRMMNQREGLE